MHVGAMRMIVEYAIAGFCPNRPIQACRLSHASGPPCPQMITVAHTALLGAATRYIIYAHARAVPGGAPVMQTLLLTPTLFGITVAVTLVSLICHFGRIL